MEIRQDLSQKLLQGIVITPQLKLAIRLLQLSRMELAEEVQNQLEANPVLEEDGRTDEPLQYDDLAREHAAPADGEPAEHEPIAPEPGREGESEQHVETRTPGEITDWQNFVEDYNRFSSGPTLRVTNEEYPSVEATVGHKTTLVEHLAWQLQLSDLDESEQQVGAWLIGNLNDDGYLVDVTVDEAAAATGESTRTVERVLARLQTFDPVGVAARDLKECLLIQARAFHPDLPLLQQMIERHLPDLERRNFPAIARGLRCGLDQVKALVETLQTLEPKPGRGYGSDDVVYIQPDVYVLKVGGEYITVLNEDGLPKLKISQYYEQALGGMGSGEAREFIKDKLRSAMWLIRSIHQRQSTIRKVTESIMRFQRDFLDQGVTHLRLLVLRDVAEDVGMHESTISRVTTNKYVHTPRGIFELKYFFNSRIGSVHGEDQSSEGVKARIKALVEAEDPTNPLSDLELVEKLRRENVVIARRTVAKYREAVGILPSSRRRRLV
ncbi:MAG TPA: RNA polymerase factor sigma-54 [Myxococcota bacterium]|nr:RNA polymerase factor sigma-54 [Myxococcota bacterium]